MSDNNKKPAKPAKPVVPAAPEAAAAAPATDVGAAPATSSTPVPKKLTPRKATPALSPEVAAQKAELAEALVQAQAVVLPPSPTEQPKSAKEGKESKAAKPVKVEKPVRPKLVRDSFTMPDNEYAQIAVLKKRLANADAPAKKSELLRAGIALLASMSETDLLAAVDRVPRIKTGRPAKGSKSK